MNKLKVVYDSIIGSKLRSSLLIGIVCIATFGNTLFNDYNLDDNLVTQNHRLTAKGIKAIPEIYRSPYYQDDMGYSYGYRPTTLASFAIEHDLFGESPLTSHSINLLLYLVTCILVFLLISRIFPDQIGIALGTALLFTVHPIHTEVVASIKNRDEMLALLFALMGCFMLIRPKRWLPSLLLGSFFFFLSLTSKVSGVNFILLLALVPAYPKPFFKDLLLLALYAFSLYFVFEGRDVFGDSRYRNITIITIGFLFLRLNNNSVDFDILTSFINGFRNTLNKIFSKTFELLTTSISSLKEVFMQFIPTSDFELSRKIEILIASIATIWICWGQIEWYLLALSILIIVSFNWIPTNKPDAFFRFAFFLVLSQQDVETMSFLLIHFTMSVIIGNRRQLIYQLISISVFIILLQGLKYFSDYGVETPIYVLVLVLVLLLHLIFQSISLKWYLILLIMILGIGTLISVEIYPSESNIIVFFTSLVASLGLILKLTRSTINSKVRPLVQNMNQFRPVILKNISLHVLSIIGVSWMVQFSNQSSFTSIIMLELTNKAEEMSLEINESVASVFDHINITQSISGSLYWSADKIHSWKRPFDYVEHPLSPFAPVGWKIGTAAETIGRYTQALFLPYPLAFYYGFDEIRISHIFSARSLAFVSLHIAILFLGIYLIRRNPAIAIGILLYLSSIVLFSGMAEMVAGMFSDRFSYVASFGFCLAITGAVAYILKSSEKTSKTLISILSILTICSFSAYSICRNSQWKNKLTLMQHDIKNVPNSAQAHNLLGHAIMENVSKDNQIINSELSDVKNAASHLTKATEIYPLFFNAWVDLARVYDVLGDVPSSIKARENAIKIDSTYPPVILQVAHGYEATGEYEKALRSYRNYLKLLEPNSYEAYDNLARILFQLQRYEESISVCQSYLKIDPNSSEFLKNIELMKSRLENSGN